MYSRGKDPTSLLFSPLTTSTLGHPDPNKVAIMAGIDDTIDYGTNTHDPETCSNQTARKTMMSQQQAQSNREEYEQLFGVEEPPGQQPTTTRRELWSYYLYYNG